MIYPPLKFRQLSVVNSSLLLASSFFVSFLILNPIPLLLIATAGMVVATIILLNPMTGFAISFIYFPSYFLILSYIFPKSLFFSGSRDILFILYLFSLSVGVMLNSRRKMAFHLKKQEIFLIFFIIYSTLLLIYHGINIDSLSEYRYLAFYPLLIISSKYYFSENPDSHKFLNLIVIGCSSIFALIGILQYLDLISTVFGTEARSVRYYGVKCISGYFIYSTLVGVGIIFLCSAIVDNNRRKLKKLIFILLVLHVLCLMLSFVIASWIAVTCSILYFFFVSRWKIYRFILLFLCLISALLVVNQLVHMIGGEGIMESLAMTNPYKSGSIRLSLWRSFSSQILDNPFGMGLGKFSGAFGSEMSAKQLLIADGGFLRIFYSTGVLGCLLYLSFFYFELRTLIKVRKDKKYTRECDLAIMLTIFFIVSSLTRDMFLINHVILPLYLLYGKLNSLSISNSSISRKRVFAGMIS